MSFIPPFILLSICTLNLLLFCDHFSRITIAFFVHISSHLILTEDRLSLAVGIDWEQNREHCVCIYQPLHMSWMQHKVNFWVEFSRFEFSFPSTWLAIIPRFKSPVLHTILPIAGERIAGFVTFQMEFVLYEIQTALFRVWTWIAIFISYDDIHYTTRASTESTV